MTSRKQKLHALLEHQEALLKQIKNTRSSGDINGLDSIESSLDYVEHEIAEIADEVLANEVIKSALITTLKDKKTIAEGRSTQLLPLESVRTAALSAIPKAAVASLPPTPSILPGSTIVLQKPPDPVATFDRRSSQLFLFPPQPSEASLETSSLTEEKYASPKPEISLFAALATGEPPSPSSSESFGTVTEEQTEPPTPGEEAIRKLIAADRPPILSVEKPTASLLVSLGEPIAIRQPSPAVTLSRAVQSGPRLKLEIANVHVGEILNASDTASPTKSTAIRVTPALSPDSVQDPKPSPPSTSLPSVSSLFQQRKSSPSRIVSERAVKHAILYDLNKRKREEFWLNVRSVRRIISVLSEMNKRIEQVVEEEKKVQVMRLKENGLYRPRRPRGGVEDAMAELMAQPERDNDLRQAREEPTPGPKLVSSVEASAEVTAPPTAPASPIVEAAATVSAWFSGLIRNSSAPPSPDVSAKHAEDSADDEWVPEDPQSAHRSTVQTPLPISRQGARIATTIGAALKIQKWFRDSQTRRQDNQVMSAFGALPTARQRARMRRQLGVV